MFLFVSNVLFCFFCRREAYCHLGVKSYIYFYFSSPVS